jgi:hypothetical protein
MNLVHRVACVSVLVLVGGCYYGNTSELAGSDKSIMLVEGDTVVVARPEIAAGLDGEMSEVDTTPSAFAARLEAEMIKVLNKKGVKARSGSGSRGTTLKIKITKFEDTWSRGTPDVEGEATLTTPKGRHAIMLKDLVDNEGGSVGVGSVSIPTGISDEKAIEWITEMFAGAVVKTLVE